MWQGVNASYTGGSTPITGLDRVISSQVAALNDGSDNLASIYDIGDGLHPNEAGRQIIGLAIRTGLLADGLVT
jgi:lysophospholipase L1-like esterase